MNEILTSQLIANDALATIGTNNSFLCTSNRQYQAIFGDRTYQTGDFVQLRRQNRYFVNRGRVAVDQPTKETSEILSIDYQLNVMTDFNMRELTLSVNDDLAPFNERYVQPMATDITFDMESIIAQLALTQLNLVAGSPTSPLSFASLNFGFAQMRQQCIQIYNDAYAGIDVMQGAELSNSQQNAFNNILNTDISFASQLGHFSVFDVFTNQAIVRHQAGSYPGGGTVATTVPSGSSTINLTGLPLSDPNLFKAGDIVRFTGINQVRPIGLADLGVQQTFSIQENVGSDGAGNATITVNPPVISDPADVYRNVSAPIVATTPITLEGAPNSTYTVNVIYVGRGLDVVIPPIAPLTGLNAGIATNKDSNTNLAIHRYGDIYNALNLIRVDVLMGVKWHPQYCFRLHSI